MTRAEEEAALAAMLPTQEAALRGLVQFYERGFSYGRDPESTFADGLVGAADGIRINGPPNVEDATLALLGRSLADKMIAQMASLMERIVAEKLAERKADGHE